jgi:hypothetical protein
MTSTGANTISTQTFRNKWRLANLDTLLRNGLVAEKIAMVDRTDAKTIQSPYGSQPVTVISALTGTYAVADYTTTDSTLTVADEFKVAEQVYDFENTLANFDLFANRSDEQAYSVMASIDQYVVNGIAAGATGSYTTPAGGFTTAANLNTIMANLISKVSGYSEVYNGLYLVVENTDLAGIVVAQATNGFSYADSALNNGFVTSYMGVDIYVVRTGTFVTATQGTQSWTNSGCRLFGVKNMATYAAPRGVQFEEKGVSGKTGKEVVTYGYCGVKVWAAKAALSVKITLA